MDDSNSNLLDYGFTSLDDEIAKDQMDAEHVFRNDSTNLDNSTSGADAVLQNVNPSTILDMTSQQDILSQDSQSCDAQQTDIQTAVDSLKVKSRLNYAARSRKRKITRNMKDENAPKLPQTGYVMYMTERRDSIKALYPNISFPELTKRIAAEWSNMDSATKKRYLDTAEENKAKYLEELSAYQQTEAFKSFQKRKQQETDTCKPMPQQIVANPPKEQQAKLPGFDVPIFTEDFLEHNKAREKELRELRKLNTQYEEQNAILSKHVDQLKAVLTSLEEEATIQRNNNLALVQHLESLRDTLVSNFTSIPLPDTNEVPTVGTVDNYMAKLHQLILDTPQEHEELIVAVREVVNKLNLEAYVT